MKKPTTLAPVLEVASLKRDEALRTLGQAQREYQQALAQMQQLQGYTQESLQRWGNRATQGVSPMLMATQQTFMAKLEHAITFQNGVLQRLQLNIDHCQHLVMQTERDLASLNKFAERREQQWQHQLQRQDQRQNDEMAANLHRQSTSGQSWRHP